MKKIIHPETICVILCSACIGGCYIWGNPDAYERFEALVINPKPESVKIVYYEFQGGLDEAVFFYFTANPEDIMEILKVRRYEIKAETDGNIPNSPVWWKPETMNEPILYYWEKLHDKTDTISQSAWLWVNKTKDEAYFAHWFY